MDVQRQEDDGTHNPNAPSKDEQLPECKIKRNYSCNHCTYFTQNPRFYLTHLRDIHGERIVINKCNLCLYASRHYQKLVRHMKMVHGSTEGIAGQSRKRASPEDSAWHQQQKKPPIPPLVPLLYPVESSTFYTANLSNDLELSRNSLKDIAALYFAENQIDKIMTQMEVADTVQFPPPDDVSVTIKRKATGSSFFDELKKSFVEEENLTCKCGYVPKCFSESVIHRKSCDRKHGVGMATINLSSGSTRCQHCRRRCKSSVDLMNHLKCCSQSGHLKNESSKSNSSLNGNKELEEVGETGLSISIEKPVFVWNKVPTVIRNFTSDNCAKEKVDVQAKDETPQESNPDNSYFGVETAPGYGEVTKKMTSEEEATSSSLKKVFKCPRCSFWASTASRFHVHIVGHLNKKPFRCSLCAYRSNWRWDITKHIRLKTLRNLSHKNARVLMNDETGRRNYTKYNQYITLMTVTEEDGDPKLIKSTPNQVASLAFLNDLNKKSKLELADDNSQQPIGKDEATEGDETSATTEQKDHQPHITVKPSIDLIDMNTEGLKEGTFFKCRMCQFSHANRDAAHVCTPSSSFKPTLNMPLQAVVNSPNLYMDKVFAATICLSQKQEPKSHIDNNNNQHSVHHQLQNDTSPVKDVDPIKSDGSIIELARDELNDQISSVLTAANSSDATAHSTFQTTSVTSASSGTSPLIGGACKPAMLIGVSSSTNFVNDITVRKEPSPFRCGHCHQVSNWKHVIQRHCRLKHSGYIRIEAYDRLSNGRAPAYRPLDFYGNGQQRDLLNSPAKGYNPEVLKANQQHNTSTVNNSKPNKSTAEHRSKSSASSSNLEQDSLLNHLEVTKKSSSPTQHLKCQSCPYIAQNKTQFNVHTSLHKPNQYGSKMCSNASTKNQYKSNQMKTNDEPPTNSPDDGKQSAFITTSTKKLQQHLKAHGADLDVKCDSEKSEHLAKDCREDPENPSRPTQKTILPETGPYAWVVAETQQKSISPKKCKTSISTPASESCVPEKCSYCPFQTSCPNDLHRHLQHHIRVSKCPEKYTCEHCDFSTASESIQDEHTQIHFKAIDSTNSVQCFTSYDDLELIVTDDSKVKNVHEDKPLNKVVKFKSDSSTVKVPEKSNHCEKTEGKLTSNLRRSRRSKTPPPQLPSHKTILVNPKTGQIIRRT